MEYTKLGNTGLDVSRIALGCMGYGDPNRWHHPWTLTEDKARPLILKALDLGINYFDTANCYAFGDSEEILGHVLQGLINRDEIVIETKVNQKMRQGPNGSGSSRKALMAEIDHSLQRLATDYVDIYILHRWDPCTPIEETVEAMQDIVKAGKARYIGCSTMAAWQFQKARNIAERRGGPNFICMQANYSLIYREEEREMIPYCADTKVGVTCYSPLAAGRLAMRPGVMDDRRKVDSVARKKFDATADIDLPVIERTVELADRYGVPVSAIALAWLLSKGPVVAPLIGAAEMSHFEDAEKALQVRLTSEDIAYLEELYKPHVFVDTSRNA
jgi:aryl-alcohol dehydrogenase-like predicted oxidoreductase